MRRAEAGGPIPYLDPAEIPVDDREFTAWYRSHARRFFEVDTQTPKAPFDLHDLEHKATAERSSFDALACDGGNTYVKYGASAGGSWTALDVSMRGHRASSKEALKGWILPTYSRDRLQALPPIAGDRYLLKTGEAKRKVRGYLKRGVDAVIMPLGHHDVKVMTHQPLRLSAFVCRDPAQWKALSRQFERLAGESGCGLEILALRRGYKDRKSGSLVAVASEVYTLINAGKRNFSKILHLTRLSESQKAAITERLAKSERLKDEAWDDLLDRIDRSGLPASHQRAAIVCDHPEAVWLD